MRRLNEQLFAAKSAEERQALLLAAHDFLLEPLIHVESAVLPVDSIYRNCHTIDERFAAFDAQMEERIRTAKTQIVKTILQEMKDFCLERRP